MRKKNSNSYFLKDFLLVGLLKKVPCKSDFFIIYIIFYIKNKNRKCVFLYNESFRNRDVEYFGLW